MVKTNKMPNKPFIYVITSCILYGTVGVLIEGINNMETGSILFYRLFFGLIGIILFIIVTKRHNELYLSKNRPYMVLRGILNIVCMFSYFLSIKYAGVSIAVMLLYTSPIYVTILSPILFKERINTRSMFALMLSIAGIFMLINPGNINSAGSVSNYPLGIFFGLIAGLSNAGNILAVNHLKAEYSGIALLFWSTLMGMVILLPYATRVSGQVLFENLDILLQLGFVLSAFASLIYMNGAVNMKAQTASVLALLEPVSSIFFGYMILNDPIFASTIKGCGLILMGAFMIGIGDSNMFGRRNLPLLGFRKNIILSCWKNFQLFQVAGFRRY